MNKEIFRTGSFYPQMKAESQCYQEDDVSNTLVVGTNPGWHNALVYDARGNGEGGLSPTITGDHQNRITDYTAIALEDDMDNQYVVRRLTPMECERLQGYPDNWTNIGEWTDSKGKKHKDADSPRYKALGNSLALPFWDWLAGRMCEHFDYQPTMASLFDGISGFPLVFERHGAKAIWASEVDEFAIAVAKRHFPEGGEENAKTAENL